MPSDFDSDFAYALGALLRKKEREENLRIFGVFGISGSLDLSLDGEI